MERDYSVAPLGRIDERIVGQPNISGVHSIPTVSASGNGGKPVESGDWHDC